MVIVVAAMVLIHHHQSHILMHIHKNKLSLAWSLRVPIKLTIYSFLKKLVVCIQLLTGIF